MVLPGGIYSLVEETNNCNKAGEKWKNTQSSNYRHISEGLEVRGRLQRNRTQNQVLKATMISVWGTLKESEGKEMEFLRVNGTLSLVFS